MTWRMTVTVLAFIFAIGWAVDRITPAIHQARKAIVFELQELKTTIELHSPKP